MFSKNEYYVVTPSCDVLKTVVMLSIVFLVFGEIMYERGKASVKEK